MFYGTECWAVRNQHENKVSVAQMRMLRWLSGKTRHDRIRNDTIRESDHMESQIKEVNEDLEKLLEKLLGKI